MASRCYVARRGDSYTFDATAPYESDFDAFRRIIRQARLSPHADEKARLYSLASEYYVGDLFVDQPDAPWAERPREEARTSAQRALRFLVGYHQKRGEKRLADEVSARRPPSTRMARSSGRGARRSPRRRSNHGPARTWLQRGQTALGRQTPSLDAMADRLAIPPLLGLDRCRGAVG